jgi:cytochrome c556
MKAIQPILAAMLLVGGFAGGVQALEGATGIVQERAETMKGITAAVKQIKAMLDGKAEYKPARVEELARAIAAHSGDALLKQFPKGSAHPPSEAKPEIWEDWQEFSKHAAAMQKHALRLADGAARAETASGPYKDMHDVCRDCHKPFRAKKKKR